MQIIKATEAHISDIARAEASIFSDAWSESAVRSHLSSPTSRALLLLEDGALLGYLLGSVIPPEGEVYRVAVLEGERRRGAGTLLLDAFLKEAPVCFLEVRKSNAAARALYEKHGFILIAERKNYYKAPVEDACIYKREV